MPHAIHVLARASLRVAVLTAILLAGASLQAQTQAGEQARALFDTYWAQTAEMFPEWATYRGDHRFGDRLNDGSPEARARWYAFAREKLAGLDALPRAELSAHDRMSVDVLALQLRQSLVLEPFPGYRSMTVDASPWPFQASFGNLLRASPVAT
jgi:uncharacterized protein (DUF885 family)